MSISSLTGKICPVCQAPFSPEAEVAVCGACGTLQHRVCWQTNQHCVTDGCAGMPFLHSDAGSDAPVPRQTVTPSIPPPLLLNQSGQRPVLHPSNQAALPQEIYVEGEKTLIVHENITFPPICLATGNTERLVQRKRKESWGPYWVLLIAILSPLIGIIVYFCVKKTGRIQFYLEQEYAARRTKILIGNWCLFMLSFVGALMALEDSNTAMFGLLLLFISICVPTVIYFVFLKLYTVQKIDKGYLWLKFRNADMVSAIYVAYHNQQRNMQ